VTFKKLNVGKGSKAFRMYPGPPEPVPSGNGTVELTDEEVHRIFYDRLIRESEKLAERLASEAAQNTQH
jgi:hypothetical protein